MKIDRSIIYVLGYPRSGNTFIEVVLNRLFKGIVSSSHNHSVEYLLNRLGNNLVVPIRNPIDSVSSWVAFRKFEGVTVSVEQALDSYIAYYHALKQNGAKICLLDFDKFKDDISYVKTEVGNYFGNILDKPITMEKVLKEMDNHYRNFSPNRNSGKADSQLKQKVKQAHNFDQAHQGFMELRVMGL